MRVGAEALHMCRNGRVRLEDNLQEPVFSFHHADLEKLRLLGLTAIAVIY